MILQGNCLDKLKELPDNSVDSIVTDPPYELGFMGKSWDNTGIANNVDMWKECLRVLKPGGYLLAFSGTRTYHRMASAIEDAGFEIRDMIEWVYGCLSEDTEILTINGWEHYNKTKRLNSNIPILIYDVENNFYKWEKPKRWSEYNINKDTCYRIKSDTTDQLVSRNHNCLVEREGKLIFIKAEELQEVEYMPILSDNFSILSERQRELLQSSMLWKSKNLVEELFSKWFGQEMSEQRNENGKESCLERRSDLLQEERQLWEIQNKICEMSRTIYQYGEKGWLCNGTPIDNGETYKEMSFENRSDTSQRPQSREQQDRELNSIQEQQGTQNLRGYGITKAKVTKEEYSGIIFCPTVSTGAFVARRNGQVFITGNSGFPKSHNIGKAVDKLRGEEREIVGYQKRGNAVNTSFMSGGNDITKGNSEWEGWGTALKPAHEPICMARKPLSEKTVAENVLKYGTGGINIDESRVGTESESDLKELNRGNKRPKGDGYSENTAFKIQCEDREEKTAIGRFPANLIHDGSEEVRECFPDTKGDSPNRKERKGGHRDLFVGTDNNQVRNQVISDLKFTDSGNASRFFKSIIYQAKASKSERNNFGNESFIKLEVIKNICDEKQQDKSLIKEEIIAKLLVDMEQSQIKVIEESGIRNRKDTEWNTMLFGKILMEKYQQDIQSIIKTKTNSTMKSTILKWLIHLLTKEYMVDVNLLQENGGNHVENAEQSNELSFIINEKMVSLLGVENVVLGTQLKIRLSDATNFHSTVKPLKLMEYLIKMVTPKGGVVLDPFAGSGTTLVASKKNGFRYIGIELTEEYIPIINARLSAVETEGEE